MNAVWKFPLIIVDRQFVQMPELAIPLFVAEQYGALCLWAEVNPDAISEAVEIAIVGTGHPKIEYGWGYIGSAICEGGALVWHIYAVSP